MAVLKLADQVGAAPRGGRERGGGLPLSRRRAPPQLAAATRPDPAPRCAAEGGPSQPGARWVLEPRRLWAVPRGGTAARRALLVRRCCPPAKPPRMRFSSPPLPADIVSARAGGVSGAPGTGGRAGRSSPGVAAAAAGPSPVPRRAAERAAVLGEILTSPVGGVDAGSFRKASRLCLSFLGIPPFSHCRATRINYFSCRLFTWEVPVRFSCRRCLQAAG